MEQPQAQQNTSYALTKSERDALVNLNTQRVLGKAAVYDAESASERAKSQLRDVETAYQAALSMLAAAHDMVGARLSDDLTKLTR
jgi:hypothetical protein